MPDQVYIVLIPVVASALIAFGVVKGKLHNFITYNEHRKLCAAERSETNRINDKLFAAQAETRDMVKEIHGYLKAKNGGKL
jgi:hypothetical protein